jgi:hypothetical protein
VRGDPSVSGTKRPKNPCHQRFSWCREGWYSACPCCHKVDGAGIGVPSEVCKSGIHEVAMAPSESSWPCCRAPDRCRGARHGLAENTVPITDPMGANDPS